VKLAQLYAPSRTTSVVDLSTNTLGSILGTLIGWPLSRWVWRRLSVWVRQLIAARALAGCAAAAAAGLLFAGLTPFDLSLDVSDLKAAVKQARLIPFGPLLQGPAPPAKPWAWTGEFLSWTLAGGLCALAVRESGQRGARTLCRTVALCGGLSLAIEAVQIIIPSREIDCSTSLSAPNWGRHNIAWGVSPRS
jgi:VanZ family protein